MNNLFIEIFFYFLKLGLLGFGGPLALISSMQKDLVENKKWISENDFNAAFSLIKAMPGPIAFMVAVFLGRHRGGYLGGLLAAIGLVLPPAILMILFSLFFKNLANLSYTEIILLGMQVCALGVILASLKGLMKAYAFNFFFWILVIVSGLINYIFPQLEPIIIIVFGIMMVVTNKVVREKRLGDLSLLFLVCFKAGALVFGSGLAIVPMLKQDVVENYHWLTNSEFLNALAFGQMTPGPVVITATFIGHHVHGLSGALVATVGIFSASFFHMMTWFPKVVQKLQGKKWITDFIFGAVAAVVGPIIVTVLKLFLGLQFSYLNILFLILAFIITLKSKIPLWLIIPGGGLVFYLVKSFI
jgi:chromate transporter